MWGQEFSVGVCHFLKKMQVLLSTKASSARGSGGGGWEEESLHA